MSLSVSQIQFYKDNGFLLIERLFNHDEVESLLSEMKVVLEIDTPRKILEKNGLVRSYFAPELDSNLFAATVRDPRVVHPARQLLEDEVYIHQSKINTKFAFDGDWWAWHQDYAYWKHDDGMKTSNVLTVMIYLNDATEFNGPLLVVPGSHRIGLIDDTLNQIDPPDSMMNKSTVVQEHLTSLTSNLKYTIKKETLQKWIADRGIVSAKGAAGSVLFFHGNVFHGSSNNMSPDDRHAFLITYNAIRNKLEAVESPRPSFLANRDFNPISF